MNNVHTAIAVFGRKRRFEQRLAQLQSLQAEFECRIEISCASADIHAAGKKMFRQRTNLVALVEDGLLGGVWCRD